MTDEFINKHDVLQLIDSVWQKWDVQTLDQFYDELREEVIVMPTIFVNMVRCHECLNWDTDWFPKQDDKKVHYCPVMDRCTDGMFYCGKGEKE